MEDTVWVKIQATCRCLACSEATAVNAAIERLACVGCGAEFGLREELWNNALSEARAYAADLDANATTKRDFHAGGMTLTLAIAAVDAVCPHCKAPWHELPEGSCPKCGTEVSVRSFAAGTLVGEDRHMLAGTRGEVEPQTLSCSGCGAPLTVDGSSRKITCQACTRETVAPDEIWRRVHAPRTVANWWLYGGGTRSAGLTARIRPQEMVGDSGVVYVLGWYGDTPWALFALEVQSLGIRWMVDLEQIGKEGLMHLVCSSAHGRLFAYKQMSTAIEVFDVKTGTHLQTIPAPQQITDLAPDPDGTIVCRTMVGELFRIDAQGQPQELWVKRGFFGRLFGGGGMVGGPPKDSMRGLENGRLGIGLDGELRVISRRWIGRLARDGELRWSVEISGANVAIVAPVAAPDGTTFAVLRTVGGSMTIDQLAAFAEAMAEGVQQSSSVLVRIPPDGAQAIAVRHSGPEEFTSLAVTAQGELWLATGEGEVMRLSPQGELLWRQAAVE